MALLFGEEPSKLTKVNTPSSPKNWPVEVKRIEIPCSDAKTQRAMWFSPSGGGRKPLLVALHTWSGDFAQVDGGIYARWCTEQGWSFLHPDFRGPNRRAEAMGSDRAVNDIIEAVNWATQNAAIDSDRIYLIGVSGGAYMALLTAGRHPEIWAGVSVWCPISDIARWHTQRSPGGKPDRYALDVEACIGGPPTSEAALQQAKNRSPLTWLKQASSIPLDINAGIHDGRAGTVPFTHSLRAYNAVVGEGLGALDAEEVEQFYADRKMPEGWSAAPADPVYARWTPIFRAIHDNVRVTIFSGGHEIVYQAGLNWLALQRRGKPAVWAIPEFSELAVEGGESGR